MVVKKFILYTLQLSLLIPLSLHRNYAFFFFFFLHKKGKVRSFFPLGKGAAVSIL